MTVLPVIVENTMKHQKIPNFDDIVEKHLSFGIAGRDIKNDKVILERNLELSNEMKNDMIYGLRIYPIKMSQGSVKGIWPALASWPFFRFCYHGFYVDILYFNWLSEYLW